MMERNNSDELIALARGPNKIVNRYNGFIINGFKFHTREWKKFRKIQNSGVMVEADENPIMMHLKISMSWIIIENLK